jgi:hypothetical protein
MDDLSQANTMNRFSSLQEVLKDWEYSFKIQEMRTAELYQ